jgi:hypothetical protein
VQPGLGYPILENRYITDISRIARRSPAHRLH